MYLNAPPTLRALFEASAAHAERKALVYEDERWSYAELHARVAALCRVVAEDAGVARGDRVSIGMRNLPEWPLAFWATQCLGAVAVPLNAFWTGPDLHYALDHSHARVAIVDGERLLRLAKLLPELSGLKCYATRVSEALPAGAQRLDAALAGVPAGVGLPAARIEANDDSTIGTTSRRPPSLRGLIPERGPRLRRRGRDAQRRRPDQGHGDPRR